ncbi:glycosyltransferase family 2 protein [Clostridium beijerinckii]|jgi:Glycosyltransferases, probably involved in cell wall biogenesis|uniref:Glycosyltransferase family 2 protein n=3 Tax=Clostridium beijerinckii TaxID=1520 RepID=A0AAE2V088_CLOBE|nr:glycosyltransferase family 2 protein [Clostridium beijerinckii]AIU02413.1 glycosyl transferase family protein [Clostridium beijerinckii ATCC 35702]ABR36860.1 glycosyl transferase, family 2 [Clostridium beijerinckii NCIMB 8052]MBF7808493.1 glycosyltransferase family 2 protein [Clostridium beijerinckii]NSA60652.1 glycosyltransferase involved in cell wall biosynthesis [Clostridium beijerinckii]QUF76887.1 glycosyltransferase family 2 protein [Clostridium beijerinckii]
MEVDKPLVSILLAVYKPNENWFIEQLISLNEQTYNNLELFVYDDCPDFPTSEDFLKKCITNFNYTVIRGKTNEGSNKAFEELTKIGNGEFFAYCDQDDIWEKDKISIIMDGFKEDDVTLVCSDLSIIDENGTKTANSITEIRKRIIYKSGYDLTEGLLERNFVTGCAMIVRSNIAKKAIPFVDSLVHDNWIAIIASINGKIEFVNKPLVRYRQHNSNQTGILKGIYDKNTYCKFKIEDVLERYISLKNRLGYIGELQGHLNYCITSLRARRSYFLKPSLKELKIIIKYSKYYKASIVLEIFLPIMPEFVFKYIIRLTKKGIL